jgi:hypothetical protein
MDQHGTRGANVIDMEQFRKRRAPGALPLFEATGPAARPAPAVRLARLNRAEVSHRERMLRFLTGR